MNPYQEREARMYLSRANADIFQLKKVYYVCPYLGKAWCTAYKFPKYQNKYCKEDNEFRSLIHNGRLRLS